MWTKFIIFIVILISIWMTPALTNGQIFISEDHRVECSFGKGFHNQLGTTRPDILCISKASLEEEPEIVIGCGSKMSGLIRHAHGSARDTEVCNKLVGSKSHPLILRNGRAVRQGPLVCRDDGGTTIICRSVVSGYSFELNDNIAVFPAL